MRKANNFGALALATCIVACGDGSGDSRGGGVGSGIMTMTPDDGSSGGGDADASDTLKLDNPPESETGVPGEDEECASYSEEAENMLQPADIIFIVDNSGSMGDEAAAVQANLNNFSTQISNSGVDAHVVLISSYPGNGNGICVDMPLGIGGCPGADNNPPVFTHINDQVDSHNALQRLLNNHASWAPVIRPESGLHVVVVTDDESNLDALSFDNQFKALNIDFVDYKLHGIVSMMNCDDAAAIGNVYITLGQLTGGIVADLCLQNFQPVFDELATEVIAGSVLACEWAIPVPPEGETFDKDKVNIEFDDGTGVLVTIGRVDSAADCPNVVDGWYYDNPADPTLILACPQTCERMQDAMMASVTISLGCATQPAE